MSSESTYVFAAIALLAVALLIKVIYFPLRCPRCKQRAYTQVSDISQHLILRCPKCGYMEDRGEVSRD